MVNKNKPMQSLNFRNLSQLTYMHCKNRFISHKLVYKFQNFVSFLKVKKYYKQGEKQCSKSLIVVLKLKDLPRLPPVSDGHGDTHY